MNASNNLYPATSCWNNVAHHSPVSWSLNVSNKLPSQVCNMSIIEFYKTCVEKLLFCFSMARWIKVWLNCNFSYFYNKHTHLNVPFDLSHPCSVGSWNNPTSAPAPLLPWSLPMRRPSQPSITCSSAWIQCACSNFSNVSMRQKSHFRPVCQETH